MSEQQNERLRQVLASREINTDGVATEKTERVQRNEQIIDSLAAETDMDRHIKKRAGWTHETNRQVKVMAKHWAQNIRWQYTQCQLYLDRWCQHHGPIVTKDDVKKAIELKKLGKFEHPMVEYKDNEGKIQWRIPTENWSEARRAMKNWVIGVCEKAQDRREAAEMREMDGPLAEDWADNEPFTDLPSDGNFADALIKHDPSLKKYRKDLI